MSTRVANQAHAWMHTCKIGGYHYFEHHCPVVVSNLNPLSEYWHKYPTSKLSSMSHSSALILAHIIKKNFNSGYCSCLIVTGSTLDWQVLYMCRRCKKYIVFSLLFIYLCLSLMCSSKNIQFRNLSVVATGETYHTQGTLAPDKPKWWCRWLGLRPLHGR